VVRVISVAMSGYQWLLLLLLSVLWGGSFFFVEVALTQYSPILIVTLRVSLAAVALWCFLLASPEKSILTAKSCLAFLIMGTLNNAVPFSLIAVGQSGTGASMASILNATTPVFTVLVAGLFLRDEPLRSSKIIGAIIGLAGVSVLLADGVDTTDPEHLAKAAILAGAVSYACAGVYGRKFQTMGIGPITAAAGQLTASALLMTTYIGIFDLSGPECRLPSIAVGSSILGLALLSTALAYVLYFTLLATAGATNLLLVTLLIPVTAVILSVAVLGESISGKSVVGMLITAAGLSAIDGRLWSPGRFKG